MVYIRADANEIIGTGHVMRCLSIAKELREKSEDVIFFVADEYGEKIVTESGFQVVCLHSQWDNMESELETILQFVNGTHVKAFLIDSYYVTKNYLDKLHQYVRLVYIDDVDAFLYPVDIVINYNIYAKKINYDDRYRLEGLNTEFLLGCDYVPLRTEFLNVCRKGHNDLNGQIKKESDSKWGAKQKKILITSGGTDNYNIAGKLLERLKEKNWFQNAEFHVILGRFYQNEEELRKQFFCDKNVFLYRNVPNISEYMAMCDLAVTACGSTLYELCACGLPAVTYILADNQYELAKEFDVRGLMAWCGDIREDIWSCIECIVKRVEMMFFEEEILMAKGIELQLLVDGQGARRIAEKLT